MGVLLIIYLFNKYEGFVDRYKIYIDKQIQLSKLRKLFVVKIVLVLFLQMNTALAVTPEKLIKFDIPPSDLPAALSEFSTQSGEMFLFLYDDVKDIKTSGVKGSTSIESALKKLLEKTGLQARFTDEGVITIVVSPESVNETEEKLMNSKRKHRKSLIAGFIAALMGSGSGLQAQEKTTVLEEVLVTGSFIKKASQADSVSPVTNIGREDIEDSGIITPSEIFRWEPSNSGSTNQSHISGQTDTGGTANVNLRGLGIGATLVLVNGRRHTETGAVTNEDESFVDISSLMPSIMLEGIEILKDGAAATYGSDAIAGVANFKTRNDFEGFELRYDGQFTSRSDDHKDNELAAIWGTATDKTNFVVSASWFDRSPYRVLDRPENRENSKTTSGFGNPGTYTFLQDATAGTYAGVDRGSRIPDPLCGQATDSFLNGAGAGNPFNEGSTCRYDFGAGLNLAAEEQRVQTYAVLTHELNDEHKVFAEFGYTEQEFITLVPASLPILSTPAPVVGANHPGNPFGVDVAATIRPFGTGLGESGAGAFERTIDLNSHRFVIGFEGDLPWESWGYNVSYTQSENEYTTEQPDQLASRMGLALRGLGGSNCDVANGTPGQNGCLWFNPFGNNYFAAPGDIRSNSQEVLDWLTVANPTKVDTDLKSFDAVLSGDVVELPAGALSMAVGFQHRKDSRTADRSPEAQAEDLQFYGGGPDYSSSRKVNALFGEAILPVINSDSGSTLDLQLAIRYEDYDIGFDSTDYKLGGLFKLNDRFSARATWGTAFRAPTNFLLAGENTLPRTITDAFTGTRSTIGQTSGATPDLQPEEAESMNLGFTFAATDNIEFGLDYYNIEITDRFAKEGQVAVVNADAAALIAAGCTVATLATAGCQSVADPDVIRDLNTGFPSRVIARRFNAPSVDTSGIDFSINWNFDTSLGNFNINNSSTYVLGFEVQASDGGTTTELAGKRNFGTVLGRSIPELRSNTSFTWSRDNHRATLGIRYIDSYEEALRGGATNEIDSWTVADFQYNYTFSVFDENELTMTLGALNVTDENPPVTRGGNDYGYDPTVSDPRGRMWYVSLKYLLQ